MTSGQNSGKSGVRGTQANAHGSDQGEHAEEGPMAKITDGISEETRAGLERLMHDSRGFLNSARHYIAQKPTEALGLAMVGAGVIWAATSTRPGRIAMNSLRSAAMPPLERWITAIFRQNVRH